MKREAVEFGEGKLLLNDVCGVSRKMVKEKQCRKFVCTRQEALAKRTSCMK